MVLSRISKVREKGQSNGESSIPWLESIVLKEKLIVTYNMNERTSLMMEVGEYYLD
jgi:hypothetical protein